MNADTTRQPVYLTSLKSGDFVAENVFNCLADAMDRLRFFLSEGFDPQEMQIEHAYLGSVGDGWHSARRIEIDKRGRIIRVTPLGEAAGAR